MTTQHLVATEALVRRVMTTREFVHFSHVDPNGHLNAARFYDYVVNHRIAAGLQCVGISWATLVADRGVTFFIQSAQIDYHASAKFGDELEIASFVPAYQGDAFTVVCLVTNAATKELKASARLLMRPVDVKTKRPCPMPSELPTTRRAEPEKLAAAAAYVSALQCANDVKSRLLSEAGA